MSIPAHHATGDPGHVNDHNAIADALSEHQDAIASLTAATANAFYTTGGNVGTVTGTSTSWGRVNLPAGNRSTAVDTFAVYYSTRKIFYLSGYGEPRVTAADPGRTPLIISPYSAGQVADLTQWTNADGAPIAGVKADGTIYATNITPSGWTPMTLNSGYRPHPDFGYAPSYRITGSDILFRGTISKTDGTAFTTGTTIATLPSNLAPDAQINYVASAGTSAGSMWSVRIDVTKAGAVIPRFTSGYGGNGVPGWLALDGLTYELPGASTPSAPPATPTGLTVGTTTQTSIALSWSASDTATAYGVYQDGIRITDTIATSYTVLGLTPGTTHAFNVTAENAAGESAPSATVNATTVAA